MGILRTLIVSCLLILALPLIAAGPAPSAFLEVTTGTATIRRNKDLNYENVNAPRRVPLFAQDAVSVRNGSATVFDGRQTIDLPSMKKNYVAPIPPAEGSSVAALLGALSDRSRNTVAGGQIVRVPTKEIQILAPPEATRAPLLAGLRSSEYLAPFHEVWVQVITPADEPFAAVLTDNADHIERVEFPGSAGLHRITFKKGIETLEQGKNYSVQVFFGDPPALQTVVIKPASAEKAATFAAAKEQLSQELGAGISSDGTTRSPIWFLYFAHGLMPQND